MRENKSRKMCCDDSGRPVLGDVTNQLGNTGFPLVTRIPGSKPLSGNKRAAENTDNDSSFRKLVCTVLGKVEKEKCSKGVSNEVGLSPLRGGKTYRLQRGLGEKGCVDGISGVGVRDVVVEVKEPFCSGLDSIDLGEDRHLTSVVNAGDEVNGGVLSGCCKNDCVEVGKEGQGEETRESDGSTEEVDVQVLSDNDKSGGGDCMASSGSDSAETLKLTESQETRSFGLERCTLVKGDGSHSLDAEVDLVKTCSCSFCAKGRYNPELYSSTLWSAYIWSDLQCQDIKGRISTLTKSQKEASNLTQRYSRETAISETQGSSSATDLTTLWKSLFHHMDNIYAAESSQLQSNLAVFKDVREDYKMNLEMIKVMPPDAQQCSSDDSDHV